MLVLLPQRSFYQPFFITLKLNDESDENKGFNEKKCF